MFGTSIEQVETRLNTQGGRGVRAPWLDHLKKVERIHSVNSAAFRRCRDMMTTFQSMTPGDPARVSRFQTVVHRENEKGRRILAAAQNDF